MAGNPRDKYCIVGVGETEYSRASVGSPGVGLGETGYSRASGRTIRALAAEPSRLLTPCCRAHRDTSSRDFTPFPIVLVELDEPVGAPRNSTAGGLPATCWTATSTWRKREVGVGKGVEAVFQPVEDQFMLPQWRLIDEPDQGFTWSHEAPEG